MNSLSPADLLAALNWRYATKKFDPARKIPDDLWSALEQALVLSPSSYGLQPWRFVVVTSPALKEQLVPVSWNQTQPRDCSHHVVFTVKRGLDDAHVDRYLARIAEVRGTPAAALGGFRQMLITSLGEARAQGTLDTWQTHQAYIALGQFMAAAAALGVDTCPMEGIQPAEYDRILGLAGTGYATVVACAAGYRADDDKYATLPKVRFPAVEVVRVV
jgi:nitroreductase